MADTNADIRVNIDTSSALSSLKLLQAQISAFHTQMSKSGAAAAQAAANIQQNLLNNINATGQFSAQIKTVASSTEAFTTALEKNKFSIGQYFKYAGGASKSFGKFFRTEFDTITKVATERVKDLQTQYIKMGRDANGALKAIAVRPLALDMENLTTRTMMAAQKQQLLNQLLKQGSTQMLNWGKNTQWAGRQLMVGFTIPLSIAGSAAVKTFMEIEEQVLKFRRVYGDLNTTIEDTDKMVKSIRTLATTFTQYGVSVKDTMGLAAQAAASGKMGADLMAQVTEATRLSVLGQIDQQQALESTMSVTNAFGIAAEDLAKKINFLNAAENQTVTSIDDLTIAIPKAAPVIKQLGGDVEDLTFFLTAMKEGGINASEGANALKSGLAAMINPTGKAAEMLEGFGINLKKMVEANKGDVKSLVVDFATALNQLDPLNRARAIEQLFGKFQFARISTLFKNVTDQGSQASRVLELASSSSIQLANLASQELNKVSESPMFKFKKAIEDIKTTLMPIGEEFLKAVTPVIEFGTSILKSFNKMDGGVKQFIVTVTGVVAGIGPILLMTFGLLANGVANIIKGFSAVKNIFNRATSSSKVLGESVSYLTQDQIEAYAAASSLEQAHSKLTQAFTVEKAAVDNLRASYERAAAAQTAFMGGNLITRAPGKKFAGGGLVSGPGTGTSDSIPAMVSNGEAIIPAKTVKKYPKVVGMLLGGKIPGFADGGSVNDKKINIYAENKLRLQQETSNVKKQTYAPTLDEVLSVGAVRVGEARGIVPSQASAQAGKFTAIANELEPITQKFVDKVKLGFDETYKNIQNSDERLATAWGNAGREMEKELNALKDPAAKKVLRMQFGLDEDIYNTVPTQSTSEGSAPSRGRKQAFKIAKFGVRSYASTGVSQAIRNVFAQRTGMDPKGYHLGHITGPKTISSEQMAQDPESTSYIKKAFRNWGKVFSKNATDGAVEGMKESTQTASPSKKAKKVGEDVGQGALDGLQSKVDDAAKAGENLGDATVRGTRKAGRRAMSSAGIPGGRQSPGSTRVSRRAQTQPGYYENGVFIPTTIRGDVLTSGVSDVPYGPNLPAKGTTEYKDYRKSLKTQKPAMGKMQRVVASGAIGMAASTAVSAAAMAPGQVGQIASQILPLVSTLSMVTPLLATMGITISGAVLGPLLGVAAALGLLAIGINAGIEAKKKEIEKTNALNNAMSVSAPKLKKLGEFTGVGYKESGFSKSSIRISGVTSKRQSDAELLVANKEFRKTFSSNVKGMRSLSGGDQEAALTSLTTSLLGQGYDEKTAQSVIDAIQMAAGKKTLEFKVADVNFTTKEGIAGFEKQAKKSVESFNEVLKKANVRNIGNVIYGDIEARKAAIRAESTRISEGIIAITNAFQRGEISGKQYAKRLTSIQNNFKLINQAAQKAVLSKMFSDPAIDKGIKKFAAGLQDNTNKLMVFQLAAAGLDVPQKFSKMLDRAGTATDKAVAEAKISRWLKNKLKDYQKTIDEAMDLGGDNTTTTDTTTQTTNTNKMTKALENQKKILEEKLKALKDINAELKKQEDFELAQMQRTIDMRQAVVSGDYLKAAMIRQESLLILGNVNKEKQEAKLQSKIDTIQAKIDKRSSNKKDGGLLMGPGTGTSDSIRGMLKYAVGGQIPINLSNGEYVTRASSVAKYGIKMMDAINTGTYNPSSYSNDAVYNINMTINGGNASANDIANMVMNKLETIKAKNNGTNKVVF